MINRLGTSVIVLATVSDDKVSMVVGVTKDLTDKIKAGQLVNMIAGQSLGGWSKELRTAEIPWEASERMRAVISSAPVEPAARSLMLRSHASHSRWLPSRQRESARGACLELLRVTTWWSCSRRRTYSPWPDAQRTRCRASIAQRRAARPPI